MIDIDTLDLDTSIKHSFLVRETVKVQTIAYSNALNNNIIRILNLLNIWIALIIIISFILFINIFRKQSKVSHSSDSHFDVCKKLIFCGNIK
jgi:hypothetical protein